MSIKETLDVNVKKGDWIAGYGTDQWFSRDGIYTVKVDEVKDVGYGFKSVQASNAIIYYTHVISGSGTMEDPYIVARE